MTRNYLVPSCLLGVDTWLEDALKEMEVIFSEKQIEKFPLSNLFVTKGGDLEIELAIAGYKPESITIETEDSKLIVSGDSQKSREDVEVIYQDIKKSSFKKVIPLSTKFDLSKAKAEYTNGILLITVPIAEERKPKKIELKVK